VYRALVDTSIWANTDTLLTRDGAKAAGEMLESRLKACKSRRFDALLGAEFSNDPTAVARHVKSFLASCSAQFEPAAAYFEMNGFDINPDRWYFDSFAYAEYGEDHEDLDWLSDWSSGDYEQLTLTGLERVQEAFDWYSNHDGHKEADAKQAGEVANLLTMVRFVSLFERAASLSDFPHDIPILATAHDFDIVRRFNSD